MGLVEVSLLVRWLIGWLLSVHMRRLPQTALVGHPWVSVLIPARNEQDTLPHLLQALGQQSFRPLEIIVIDDHSSDRTASVAINAGVTLLRAPPLPQGWCGKTWALHHGVLASSGDVLVFLDADTEPCPSFLELLLAVHQQVGGLLSVQPFHRTEKAYEQLSMLFNLVGLMAVPLGEKAGVAFGPAMVTSRSDYERSGGHAAVAGNVVEDWFLAHRYERSGLPVSAYIGDGHLVYRMYPGGIRDMVVGFGKNFATAAGEVHWPWMVAVLLWLSGLFWSAWCLPASLFGWPLMGYPDPMVNLLIYLAFAFQLLVLTRRVGSFGWVNLFYPLPVVFFVLVFVIAIFNLERGAIEWKNRSFPTR